MASKPTSTYKMPKAIKMRLANFLDPIEYNSRKRGYIEAHMFAQDTAKVADKETKKKNRGQDQSSD